MPPQKNTGNRGAKKDSGVESKNRKFIQNLMEDVRQEGKVDNIHIGRVTKKLGNGRMEVFYVNDERTHLVQSLIRGSFRGRGKRSVWIDVGSFVAIADTGLGGSISFEIVALLTADQVRDLGREIDLDPRLTNPGSEMTDSLQKEEGFDFDHKSQSEEEVDVDAI